MGDCLGLKCCDRYRGVVDLWRWLVREALLYIHGLFLGVLPPSNGYGDIYIHTYTYMLFRNMGLQCQC